MLYLNPKVSGNVLCVDGNPYLTNLFRYALDRHGCTVGVAHSGADALRIARADPPDLVLLDLHLPDMNGFSLCARLRETFHIPVIMLISVATVAEMMEAFEAGADDCIAKPFNLQTLMYKIRDVLIRHRQSTMLVAPRKVIYRLGFGTLDAEEHVVTGPLGRVRLSATQGRILRLLVENEAHVLSAAWILTKLWAYDTETDVTVVMSHISSLQRMLSVCFGDEVIIRTIGGVGFTLRQPAHTLEQEATERTLSARYRARRRVVS